MSGRAIRSARDSYALGLRARERLTAMKSRYPEIGLVRGEGLLFGVEFVRDARTRERFSADTAFGIRVRDRAIARGLLSRASHWMLALAPPLTTTEAELDDMLDILDAVDRRRARFQGHPRAGCRLMPASQNPRALGLDGPYLAVRDGCLTLEGADLGAIADRFGTPCYVTSEGQIRANYRRLREAFNGLYPATRLLYANKANNYLAVRRILAQEGAGGDCFGLLRAFLQGFRARSQWRSGTHPSPRDLRRFDRRSDATNAPDLTSID